MLDKYKIYKAGAVGSETRRAAMTTRWSMGVLTLSGRHIQ
jgi:hypothetical protein